MFENIVLGKQSTKLRFHLVSVITNHLHSCLWDLFSSFPHMQNYNFNLVSVITNVATEGVAEQSSTYSPIYEAHHAIDGSLLTDVFDDEMRAQCAITDNAVSGAWWRVDLMKYTAILGIIITTRNNSGNSSCLLCFLRPHRKYKSANPNR